MPDWLFEDSMPGLTAGIDEAVWAAARGGF